MDKEVFSQVVEEISKASAIYLLGLRSAAPLSEFFGYYLRYIFDDVRVISSTVNDTFETIARIKPGDVMIAISFPRYSKPHAGMHAVCQVRGVKVIGITDGPQPAA